MGFPVPADLGLTRVRSNSSGLQRWVLAVINSPGRAGGIAAIFSRFSPSARSAASAGGWWRSLAGSFAGVDLVGRQRPGRHGGRGHTSAWPAAGLGRRPRRPGWTGRRLPASDGTPPPAAAPRAPRWRHAPRSAARSQSAPREASIPRLRQRRPRTARRLTEGKEILLCLGFGTGSAAGPVPSRAAIMVVEDAALPGAQPADAQPVPHQ
jgi:hypothetical protein